MESVYKRDYCKNCDKPAHCGRAEYEELQNYDEPPKTLKICEYCRCGNCTNIEEYKNEF